jgi:hypothetical protein
MDAKRLFSTSYTEVIGGKDMQWVIVFKDYVPLAKTLLWVILIIIAVGIFYQPISGILGSI